SGYALTTPEQIHRKLRTYNNNETFLSYLRPKCETFWTLPAAFFSPPESVLFSYTPSFDRKLHILGHF
ncbi:MAG: hypothetical protein AAGH40_10815, partial [Verrucomicrobiota bacterium]